MDWIFSKPFRVYILLGLLWLLFSIATFSLARGESIHPPIPPPIPQAPVIYMYGPGTEPTIQKMPQFAYAGCSPLKRDDKIIGAVRYSASGKNLYNRILEYHEKVMLEKNWNPRLMRLLVVKTVKNRSWSTSGSVSASFSDTVTDNKMLQTLSKSTSSSLYGSGSIAPSFSTSYQTESFDLWFFRVEE